MKPITFLIIPGLNDRRPLFTWFYQLIGRWWSRKNIATTVLIADWHNDDAYQEKLIGVNQEIQRLTKQGREVVLVGVSAGATLATLAFASNKKLSSFIIICGFLQPAPGDELKRDLVHKSWYKAAQASEQVIAQLTKAQKQRILCLTPHKDSVIAPERAHISGSKRLQMWSSGHLLSIFVGLVWYRNAIAHFVQVLQQQK